MKNIDVYQPVWKKYLPVLAMRMKQAIRNNQSYGITLYKPEFLYVAKKKKEVFDFALEIKAGRVMNGADHTPIAKDFSEVIKTDLTLRQTMGNGHFKFTLNAEFVLTIDIIAMPSKLNVPLLRV